MTRLACWTGVVLAAAALVALGRLSDRLHLSVVVMLALGFLAVGQGFVAVLLEEA